MFDRYTFPNRDDFIAAIHRVVRLQRQITLGFGIVVLIFFAMEAIRPTPALLIVAVLGWLALIPFVVRLLRIFDVGMFTIGLAAIGMLIPIINLVVVGAVNIKVSNVLRLAGLRGGVLGVGKEELRTFEARLE